MFSKSAGADDLAVYQAVENVRAYFSHVTIQPCYNISLLLTYSSILIKIPGQSFVNVINEMIGEAFRNFLKCFGKLGTIDNPSRNGHVFFF